MKPWTSLSKFPKVKFDETVELHFHLNIDPKASDQGVRGTVSLPHGTEKRSGSRCSVKVKPSKRPRTPALILSGGTDLIDKVSAVSWILMCVVATPDMMRDLSKLGKVLGPRGLMPTPKAGTVTTDVEQAIKEVKAGKIEFKSDKQAGIHVGYRQTIFFQGKSIVENAQQVIDAINHAKPASRQR